jgi:hypothetical protein
MRVVFVLVLVRDPLRVFRHFASQLVHEALQKGEGTDEAAAAAASGKPVASAASEAVAMSSEDKEAMFSVSSTGLECRVDSSKAWAGGRSNVGLHGSGKFYFEVECVSVAGTVRTEAPTANIGLVYAHYQTLDS